MLRVLFLILILMSSSAFTQTEEKTKALKLDEFGETTNGDIRSRLDNFLSNLQNDPVTKGFIIIYGTNKARANRERLYRNHITFRNFDATRVTFLTTSGTDEIKTELWIVPKDSEPPQVEKKAYIFTEIFRTNRRELEKQSKSFFETLEKISDATGYIIFYGTDKEISIREKIFRNNIVFRRYDSPRITFVRGGNSGKLRTLLWIVPIGAENPKP